MKASELRDLKPPEMNKKLDELKSELFNLRFQHAINQLENPQRIVTVKREIARLKTVMHEGNIEIVVPSETAGAKKGDKDKLEKKAKKVKAEKADKEK
jgi:large subunit ribosomal protein L29